MQNIKKEKLYIQVFDEIKRYIICNSLEPGDKLPTESEMCDMLGISRNVLREALKIFEIMGIIESIPSKGIMLKSFDSEALLDASLYYLVVDDEILIHEIMEIRKVLELGFLYKAYQCLSSEELMQMKDLLNQMRAKMKLGEMFYEEDKQFHLTIFKRLDNKTLNRLFNLAWNFNEKINIDLKKMYQSVSYEKHVEIYEAVKQRNYNKFESLMKKHFEEDRHFAGR